MRDEHILNAIEYAGDSSSVYTMSLWALKNSPMNEVQRPVSPGSVH
jgi:hypothetical protein